MMFWAVNFDSLSISFTAENVWQYLEVPERLFSDFRKMKVDDDDKLAMERVFSIGGKTGWYYANFLWKIRGF